jgi:hypothetical protein
LKYRLLLMKCAKTYKSRYHSWYLLENSIDNFIAFTEFSFDIFEWFRSIWISVNWYWLKKVAEITNNVDLFFLNLFSLMIGLSNLILFFLYWSILSWRRFLISSESYQSFDIIFFLTIHSPPCLHLYILYLSRLLVFWLVFWLLFLFQSVWLIIIIINFFFLVQFLEFPGLLFLN